ncbi:MAG: AMP-binding protein [Candidatus Lokiarchaeota archaeon]|nr:AMP-binding protein [Candidatus Harpocratesius repetitus]
MPVKYPVPSDRPFFHGKYWPIGVPHQLDIDFTITLPDMLESSVKKWPDDPVIWFLDTFVSYSQLKNYVDSLKKALFKIGVRKGDVISLLLPNCIQYVVSYYAITSLGAVVSGINPTYFPLEVFHQLQLTESHKIIVLDSLFDEKIKPFSSEWEFDWIIETNIVDLAKGMSKIKKTFGKWLKKIPTGKVNHPKVYSFVNLMKESSEFSDVPSILINASEDVATLIMTGGTTGIPKAAELTHENVVSNAKQAGIFITQHSDPSGNIHLGHHSGLIGVIPLFHSYAHTIVMNAVISVGAWMILFPIPPPAKELVKTLHRLPNLNYFGYAGVELLFQRIIDLPEEFLRKYPLDNLLKLNLSGAGPLHSYVRKPFEAKTGTLITETYGLTEASPGVSINNIYGPRDIGTIGTPLPGTDWEIFPINNFEQGPIKEIGPDYFGEICVSGPQIMKGYFRNPSQTAETIKIWDKRRWLLTGDIGYMDVEGRIIILDRKKQLIKVAGHPVFPSEVENLIGKHPGILEVAVTGVPDKKTGEAIKAWIVQKQDYPFELSAELLKKWCKENITSWKVPKYFEFISNLPKNAIGKILRRKLSSE